MSRDTGFKPSELRKLRSLDTPAKIQKLIDSMPYHLADTAWSPRRALREGTVHCLEGAMLAAAALRVNGHEPLILDLEADYDTDHVIAVYRQAGGWGAIASSNYSSCRFRSPVYRTLRELALSYFEGYFNLRGERTLRTFSRPVNLRKYDRHGWMTTEDELWYIVEDLFDLPHTRLITPKQEKVLVRLDPRSFRAGLLGRRSKPGF